MKMEILSGKNVIEVREFFFVPPKVGARSPPLAFGIPTFHSTGVNPGGVEGVTTPQILGCRGLGGLRGREILLSTETRSKVVNFAKKKE